MDKRAFFKTIFGAACIKKNTVVVDIVGSAPFDFAEFEARRQKHQRDKTAKLVAEFKRNVSWA